MTVLALVAMAGLVLALLPRVSTRRLGDLDGRPKADEADGARPRLASGARRSRARQRDLASSMPDVADLLALCLQAGSDVSGALHAIADSAPVAARVPLRQAGALMELGVPPAEAFAQWNGVADPMIRAFERSQRTGAALAEECARVAADLRADEFGRVQQRARAVGVRAVFPLMGCFLPAFVLLGVVPVVAALAVSLFAST